MPCQDHQAEQDCRDNDALKRKVNMLTQYLCLVMTILDEEDITRTLPSLTGVGYWWYNHKQYDKERIARETALAKLSPEDKKILGL